MDSAKTESWTVDVLTTVQRPFEEATVHDPPKGPEPEEDLGIPKRDVSEAEKERARRANGRPTTQDAAGEMLKRLLNARR